MVQAAPPAAAATATVPQLQLERAFGAGLAGAASLAQHPTQPGVLAYCCGGAVVVHDCVSRQQLRFLRGRKPAGRPLVCVAFSPDGAYVAAGERAQQAPEILVWEATTGRCIQALKGYHKYGIGSLAFSSDGEAL